MKPKLTAMIKPLLPFVAIGAISTALIIFILLRLPTVWYVALLTCVNTVTLLIWTKSDRKVARIGRLWEQCLPKIAARISKSGTDIQKINNHLKLTTMNKIKDQAKEPETLHDDTIKAKSAFLQEIEAYATEMGNRLAETHEGGMILIAGDSEQLIYSISTPPSVRRRLLAYLLTQDGVMADIAMLLFEHKAHECYKNL